MAALHSLLELADVLLALAGWGAGPGGRRGRRRAGPRRPGVAAVARRPGGLTDDRPGIAAGGGAVEFGGRSAATGVRVVA